MQISAFKRTFVSIGRPIVGGAGLVVAVILMARALSSGGGDPVCPDFTTLVLNVCVSKSCAWIFGAIQTTGAVLLLLCLAGCGSKFEPEKSRCRGECWEVYTIATALNLLWIFLFCSMPATLAIP